MARRPFEKLVLFTLSTCGFGGDELGSDEKEICMLAWQVIDTTKIQPATQIEYCYIQPTDGVNDDNTPIGIEAKNLVKAPVLSEGLKKLQSVISSYPENSFCIATNGPRPLRQCLFPEMSKKALSIPDFAYSFFDLKKELSKRTNNEFHPETLKDLCEYLGVECPTDEVYGEEEIKVLARIVQKLLSQGHVFESPEIIQQQDQHSNDIDSGDVCKGCIVKLRGLPFQADHKDVARFLIGLNFIPGGLVFGINAVGRRTGEAVAVLENEEQTTLALQRDRHYMEKRYIEVYEGTPEEFLELAGADNGVTDGQAYVIRLQGLPYRASEQDICDFFGQEAPVKNGKNGVLIVRYPNGRASGDAFALFNDENDIEEAMKRDRDDMMGRYVELFTSSLKEFLMVLNKSGNPEQLDQFAFLNPDTKSANSVIAAKRGSERNCVKLRGLPWEATAEEVIEFFGDMNKYIEQHGVHMVLNAQNRPTGDCYVQMTSVDSASKAADRLHRRNMGRRYIEVFQCSGNEVTYALMDSAGARSNYPPTHPGAGGKRRRASGATIKARGIPYSTNEYDLVDFFNDFHIEECDVEIVYNQNGRSTGVAYIALSNPGDARRAVKELNNKYIGHRYIELSLA